MKVSVHVFNMSQYYRTPNSPIISRRALTCTSFSNVPRNCMAATAFFSVFLALR